MINKHPQNSNITNLLWTGGWDSTFRLLQLVVEQRVVVQPIYVMDTARASTITEIQTMDKVRRLTSQLFPNTSGLILPTYFFSIHDVAPDKHITEMYETLRKQSHLGGQYDWLARFAIQHHLKSLELSIHVDDTAYKFIKNSVVKTNSEGEEYYILNPNLDSENPLNLFNIFRFPLLEWSKVQMKEHANKIGTHEIMDLTWFCFKPVNGKPCGRCNPCVYSIEEGMAFRFPKEALLRYKMRPAYKALGKIRRLLR